MLLTIYRNLTAKQADTYGLVLSSAGISYHILRESSGWEIWVDENVEKEALFQIQKYEEENALLRQSGTSLIPRKIEFSNGIMVAVFLMAVHIAVGDNLDTFVTRYGAFASKILGGEVFRTVTALLLHADAAHLVGNMAAIIFFGSVVCSNNGFGVGWLMILLSGVLGNYLNAHFYQSLHVTIGASTAVFGAVGMMAAYQFLQKIRQPQGKMKAWLPISGGLALLAILGSGGGRVDVMAHIFGFACGLFLQLLYQGIVWSWLKQVLPVRFQAICLTIALLIIGLSCAWPVLKHPA